MENELPEGWVSAPIGSFTDVLGGSTPSRKESRYFGGDIVWLTPTEIPKETVSIISDSKERLTVEGYEESGVRWIPAGSVLLTSRASIGYVAIAGVKLTTNQGFASFVLPDEIDPKYFGWWLRSQKANLEDQAKGTTFKEISKTELREVMAPLAPTNEQHRIVAAIEQQFSRLDAGVTSLQHARAKLKRQRAAILKAAVEGTLTQEWRAQHPVSETAEQLLQRILNERRAKWKDDYKEPESPDTGNLPELPEGWIWASVEQACEYIVDCLHSTPKFGESGFLCVDTNCIKPGRIIYDKVRYVDEATFIERNRRMKLQENDVIFSREGALLGVAVKIPENLEFCLGQRMMAFRLNQYVDAKYYETVLNSSAFRSQYLKEIAGTASPHLNIRDIRVMAIPLPPLAEQQQIVSEVEARLSIIAQTELEVEANLKRAERLRQTILAEAFAGRLVPQDPDDEPASVLLERIRGEREGMQKKGKAGNRRAIRVPDEPVKIDAEGMEQVELWEGVRG